MQTNTQYLIKDLEQTRKNIISINKGIREACDQNFYNLADAYKEALDKKFLKIEDIKNTKIQLGLKDIKQKLANAWNTTEDNLFVSYSTSVDFTTFSDAFSVAKADNINKTKEHSSSNIEIRFTISSMPDDIKELQSINFSTLLNYQDTQIDGRPLYEHIEAQPILNKKTGAYPRVKIAIDNVDQIIVEKKLNELIYENVYNSKVQPRNFLSEIIINTPSLLPKKEVEMEDVLSSSQEGMLQ